MTGVKPVWIARRLNPSQANVWFVGREGDSGPLEMVELERLAEGLPYMVPSWWSSTWGPFSKADAQAIVAGRKRTPGAEAQPGTRFEQVTREIGDIRIDDAARQIGRQVAREIRAERGRPGPYASAIAFFYRHAGWSYDPARETRAQGRRRGARLLAQAEAYAERQGWDVNWRADPDPDLSWMSPEERRRGHRVEIAMLLDEHGHILESLGNIVDADENYRRVVAAELALAAMPVPREPRISHSLEGQILHEGVHNVTITFMRLPEAKALRPGQEIRMYDLTCLRHEGHGGCWKRVRVNGRPQTWVRSPQRVRVPVKYGLRETFNITEREINQDLVGTVA